MQKVDFFLQGVTFLNSVKKFVFLQRDRSQIILLSSQQIDLLFAVILKSCPIILKLLTWTLVSAENLISLIVTHIFKRRSLSSSWTLSAVLTEPVLVRLSSKRVISFSSRAIVDLAPFRATDCCLRVWSSLRSFCIPFRFL